MPRESYKSLLEIAKKPTASWPTAVLRKQIRKLMQDALKEYVSVLVDNIAVDTGMSMASLEPLASSLKMKKVIAASLKGFGIKFRRKKYNSVGFNSTGEQYKSMAAGRRLGKNAFKLDLYRMDASVKFEFSIPVLQWFLNENGLGNINIPPQWNGLIKATKAYTEYINHNWKKYMPDPRVWTFSKKLVSLSGEPLR